jgi:hypothetical protein
MQYSDGEGETSFSSQFHPAFEVALAATKAFFHSIADCRSWTKLSETEFSRNFSQSAKSERSAEKYFSQAQIRTNGQERKLLLKVLSAPSASDVNLARRRSEKWSKIKSASKKLQKQPNKFTRTDLISVVKRSAIAMGKSEIFMLLVAIGECSMTC